MPGELFPLNEWVENVKPPMLMRWWLFMWLGLLRPCIHNLVCFSCWLPKSAFPILWLILDIGSQTEFLRCKCNYDTSLLKMIEWLSILIVIRIKPLTWPMKRSAPRLALQLRLDLFSSLWLGFSYVVSFKLVLMP